MSEIKKVLRCYKCGEILQDSDKDGKGYIISEVFNNHSSDILLCNNCFEKTIFNNKPQVNDFDDDLYIFLKDARATGALVALVIDLVSFEGFTNKKFIKAIGECNVVVIANKRDLLPQNIDEDYLKEYAAHRLRVQGLNVLEVFITSKVDFDVDVAIIKQELNKLRNGSDIFLIGLPNSGKTTFANAYLKYFKNKTKRNIQTITYPDTNTQVIEMPLDRSSSLYDVPGFSTKNAVNEIVEKNVALQVLPSKVIEPRKIYLGEGDSFAIGGLATVQLLTKHRTTVTLYASHKVLMTRLPHKNPDEAFINYISKKIVKPVSKYLTSKESFDIYDISTEETGSRDIGILGLGWINFEGKGQVFRITVPKGTYVYFSRAKIKYAKK